MKDWPYKSRDLALANQIVTQLAGLTGGTLRLLEDGHENEKDHTFTFKFPVWVSVLVDTFKELYSFEALATVLDSVLNELIDKFDCLEQAEAELFKKLVLLALGDNSLSKTVH